ncbi:MAG: aromatic amino acid lyase [Chloroflexota bacterium]
MHPPVIVRTPGDRSLTVFIDVAWNDRRLSLHPELLAKIVATRAAMMDVLAGDEPVYGVNTGMGYLSKIRLSEEDQRVHQANLFMGRAVGGPPFLDRGESRAILLSRLFSFLSGEAGVTPELCSCIVDRLNDGFIPAIPRAGMGCAGEIIPMAHAFGTFLGLGQVIAPDETLFSAADALRERNVAPYQPGVKEGIALLAGAPGALALTIARWRSATALLRQLTVCWACAINALDVPLAPYDPAIAELAHDSTMGRVLERLGELLDGWPGGKGATQAPVSFRVIPQVLTHVQRVLERTEEDIRRNLPAVTDSPAFIHGRFLTSGGFHAISLAAQMDSLCIALIQVAELGGQHVHRLLDNRFSGLPDQLAAVPGPHAGLVVVHKRVVGVVHEMRSLAVPMTVGISDTSLGQEDAMTFGFEAAEKLRRVECLLREVIATELLVCRQAWALRGLEPPVGLRAYAQELAGIVRPVDRDRQLGPEIDSLTALLAAGRFQ